MADFNRIKKGLEKLGLSKNQAEIYLLLVDRKELRIQEIVSLTKIPRSTVYECLKGLFELGIAEEIVDDYFKKIRPYPIGAMRHGLDEKIFSIQKLKTDLETLEKNISIVPPDNLEDSTILRFYKGRSGAQQLFWNSLNAKNTTYVYSDWGRARYIGMKFYEKIVEIWREKKLKENVLINLTPDALESIKKYNYPSSPISRTRTQDIRIIDKKAIPIKGDTLIYNNIYAQVYLKNMKINGFEIENIHFAKSQRAIFEMLWKIAKPVSNLL